MNDFAVVPDVVQTVCGHNTPQRTPSSMEMTRLNTVHKSRFRRHRSILAGEACACGSLGSVDQEKYNFCCIYHTEQKEHLIHTVM